MVHDDNIPLSSPEPDMSSKQCCKNNDIFQIRFPELLVLSLSLALSALSTKKSIVIRSWHDTSYFHLIHKKNRKIKIKNKTPSMPI